MKGMWSACGVSLVGIVVSFEKKEMHHGITQMAFKINDQIEWE